MSESENTNTIVNGDYFRAVKCIEHTHRVMLDELFDLIAHIEGEIPELDAVEDIDLYESIRLFELLWEARRDNTKTDCLGISEKDGEPDKISYGVTPWYMDTMIYEIDASAILDKSTRPTTVQQIRERVNELIKEQK